MGKFISIIILTCNRLDLTRKCYRSILKTNYKNLEIIFVDNCSLDGTINYLEDLQKKDKRIVIIRNTINHGCFKARNQALSIARGDYIVLLDNDAYITDSNWLNKMILQFKDNERIALVCPKVIYSNSNLIYSAGGGITQEGEPFLWCQNVPKNSPLVNFEREIQYAPATCWMLKREVFEKMGYFDESYLLITFGDIDYCYRLRYNGFKIKYIPEVEIKHEAGAIWKYLKLNYVKFFEINSTLFKNRWRFMFEKEPFEYFPTLERNLKGKDVTLPVTKLSKKMVSIVIIIKNNLFDLRKILEDLFTYTPHKYELIIIDLGSIDLTPVYLANLPIKNIKVILDKSVNTISKAKEVARKLASGKKIVFIGAGQRLLPGWLNGS